jgi:hypothetical protein
MFQNLTPSGLYRGSIVWQYFIRKRKIIQQLKENYLKPFCTRADRNPVKTPLQFFPVSEICAGILHGNKYWRYVPLQQGF